MILANYPKSGILTPMGKPLTAFEHPRVYQRRLDLAYQETDEVYESRLCVIRFSAAAELLKSSTPDSLPDIDIVSSYTDRFAKVLGNFYTAAMVQIHAADLPHVAPGTVARDVGRRLVARESSERLNVLQVSWLTERPLNIFDTIRRNFGYTPLTANSPAAIAAQEYDIDSRQPYAEYGGAVGRHFAEFYLNRRPANAAATQLMLELSARAHLGDQLEYEQDIAHRAPEATS